MATTLTTGPQVKCQGDTVSELLMLDTESKAKYLSKFAFILTTIACAYNNEMFYDPLALSV